MQIANHSDLLRVDLQFFSEDDVILPDDFVMEDTPIEEEPFESVEDTTETEQTEEVDQPQEELTEAQNAFLKVKYNKEELDLDEDRARELAQKGLNYDKLVERVQQLETDPRLSFVEELAREQNLEVNEYLQQVQEWREQEKLNQLIQSNIPEDLAKEILEARKDREVRKQQEQQQQVEQKKQSEAFEFFEYFKQATGKEFNNEADQIPQEVWDINSQGVPLKYAYMQHHNQQLQNQIKILKQNESNAKKAPIGSLSAHGSADNQSEDPFLSGFDSI